MKKIVWFFAEWVIILVCAIGIILTVPATLFVTKNASFLSLDNGIMLLKTLMWIIFFTMILFGVLNFGRYGISIFGIIIAGISLILSWLYANNNMVYVITGFLTFSLFLSIIGGELHHLEKLRNSPSGQ